MPINAKAASDQFSFLHNTGETSQLIRSIDWSKNELGPVNAWPPALRITLSIIMNSKFPMFLFWGDQFTCFYNDAYRPSLGDEGKHPTAMGQKGKDCWPEIWEFIHPVLQTVKNERITSFYEDQPLICYHNEKPENVYWTFSYSPVDDEHGSTVGVFVTGTETTEKITTIQSNNENKNELAFAVNAAEIGTWDLDPFTNKLTINDRLKEWYGVEGNEMELNVTIDRIDPDDRPLVFEAVNKAMQFSSGGAYKADFAIYNASTNKKRFIRAIGKVIFDEEQKPCGFSGIKLDVTREKLHQKAEEEKENNFSRMVEQAPVAICVLKKQDLIVTVANSRMLTIWGKTPEEVMGKPVFSCFPDLDNQGLDKILWNVVLTGKAYTANELPYTLQRDGKESIIYLNYVYEPFKNKEGEMDGIMAVITDVTEQVNARHEIEEAEERARLATDATNLGTYDFNVLTKTNFISTRVQAIFGQTEPLTKEEFIAFIHPEDIPIRLEAYKTALTSGILFFEIRIIWKDKSVHCIRIQGKILFDAHNQLSRSIGTVTDITDKREMDDELLKTNQRLEIALEAGKLGCYEMDLVTGVMNASKQFRNTFGLDDDTEVSYDLIESLILPPFRQNVKDAIADAITNKTVYRREYPIKRPDNSIRWIQCSAKARYDKNSKAYIFIGAAADITERKRSELQKDDFIGFASHELKTPVTTIKAYNQLMEEMLRLRGDTGLATMALKIGVQVKRLNILIADLLDVTRINSGKLPLNNTIFDFNQLVKNIADDIQNTTAKYIIIQNFTQTGFVQSDKERIVQVITNLIGNAIKYSPDANKIIIHITLKNKEVILSVQDFGIGILKEHHSKVFEQFYRITGDMQHTFPGLGLGLYISSEIIKQLGGRIWVNSNEGEGATFCFGLPVYKQQTLQVQ